VSDPLPRPTFGEPLPLTPEPAVLRFLRRRRSTSAVTLMEPAPTPAELDVILELAARVPDHGKLAPWRFLILPPGGKGILVERLEALAASRGDATAAGKLAKLRVPPLAVVVIASPRAAKIPEWEQILSAGAVCTTFLQAALAMGYGCNWITDWYSYDPDAVRILGLQDGEKVAGVMLLGTPAEAPLERERPDLATRVTRWTP
jgi:nitroreductase